MGRRKKIVSYDEKTGKPVHEFWFRCPRRGFFKLGHASLTITQDHRDFSSQEAD